MSKQTTQICDACRNRISATNCFLCNADLCLDCVHLATMSAGSHTLMLKFEKLTPEQANLHLGEGANALEEITGKKVVDNKRIFCDTCATKLIHFKNYDKIIEVMKEEIVLNNI